MESSDKKRLVAPTQHRTPEEGSGEGLTERRFHVSQARKHMATTFEFVVSCREGQEEQVDSLLSEGHEEVARLENLLSEFRETPLAAFNRAPVGVAVPLPPEVFLLLMLSQEVFRASGGAFDPTAKSVGQIHSESIDGVAPRSGSFTTRVRLDPATGTATRLEEGARVGFGAIGKGYALDQVARCLEAAGFEDFFLSAGGSSLLFSGNALPGTPWVFGWSWSRDEEGDPLGQRFRVQGTRRVALGVSGLQEQASHLLDPRRGGRSLIREEHAWQSVCLAHATAAEADAWSTALFVRGLEGFPFQGAFAGIDTSGAMRWNGAFEALFSRIERASEVR